MPHPSRHLLSGTAQPTGAGQGVVLPGQAVKARVTETRIATPAVITARSDLGTMTDATTRNMMTATKTTRDRDPEPPAGAEAAAGGIEAPVDVDATAQSRSRMTALTMTLAVRNTRAAAVTTTMTRSPHDPGTRMTDMPIEPAQPHQQNPNGRVTEAAAIGILTREEIVTRTRTGTTTTAKSPVIAPPTVIETTIANDAVTRTENAATRTARTERIATARGIETDATVTGTRTETENAIETPTLGTAADATRQTQVTRPTSATPKPPLALEAPEPTAPQPRTLTPSSARPATVSVCSRKPSAWRVWAWQAGSATEGLTTAATIRAHVRVGVPRRQRRLPRLRVGVKPSAAATKKRGCAGSRLRGRVIDGVSRLERH